MHKSSVPINAILLQNFLRYMSLSISTRITGTYKSDISYEGVTDTTLSYQL